jgi:hypothetical protein
MTSKEWGRKGGQAARGERKGSHKLTERAVIEIRESALSRNQLAALHGVYPQTISDVRNRVTWTHI